MKAKKITEADRKRMRDRIAHLKQAEKDELLSDLTLFAERAIQALEELAKQSGMTPKEKREIEDSISLGPAWLRYSRRVKRQK